MYIFLPPNSCVTLTWEDPREDIAARVVFSGIGYRCESGNLGEKDKNKCVSRLLDNVRAVQEADNGRRHSKGSASPSATNDSWRAPDSISDLEASGSNGSSSFTTTPPSSLAPVLFRRSTLCVAWSQCLGDTDPLEWPTPSFPF